MPEHEDSLIRVEDQQAVRVPAGAESASIYMDSEGMVHLADVTMSPPWWRSVWVHAAAFISGGLVVHVLWWVLGS